MMKIESKVLRLKDDSSFHVNLELGGESPALSFEISSDQGDYHLPTKIPIDNEDAVTLLSQVTDIKEILTDMIEGHSTAGILDELMDRLKRPDRMDEFFEVEICAFKQFGKTDEQIECDIVVRSDLIGTISTADSSANRPTLADLAQGFKIDRKALAQEIYNQGFDDDTSIKYHTESSESDNCPVCDEPLDVEGNCANECPTEEMEEPDEAKCPDCGKTLDSEGSCPNGCR